MIAHGASRRRDRPGKPSAAKKSPPNHQDQLWRPESRPERVPALVVEDRRSSRGCGRTGRAALQPQLPGTRNSERGRRPSSPSHRGGSARSRADLAPRCPDGSALHHLLGSPAPLRMRLLTAVIPIHSAIRESRKVPFPGASPAFHRLCTVRGSGAPPLPAPGYRCSPAR